MGKSGGRLTLIFLFRRGVLGPSERGGEERGADVQPREPAVPVRAEYDPGDEQRAGERGADAAAAVKRQQRPRTRTYIPYVETPSSVIILRLIDFLRGARHAPLGRPSIVRHARSTVAPTRETVREERRRGGEDRERKGKRRSAS